MDTPADSLLFSYFGVASQKPKLYFIWIKTPAVELPWR